MSNAGSGNSGPPRRFGCSRRVSGRVAGCHGCPVRDDHDDGHQPHESEQEVALAPLPFAVTWMDTRPGALPADFPLPVLAVPGNCDLGCTEPRLRTATIAGRKILITHGDRYGVKTGLNHLVKKGLAERADIVLFGHTHQALVQQTDGVLLVNPGTLQPRAVNQSYAILEIYDGTASATIISLDPD